MVINLGIFQIQADWFLWPQTYQCALLPPLCTKIVSKNEEHDSCNTYMDLQAPQGWSWWEYGKNNSKDILNMLSLKIGQFNKSLTHLSGPPQTYLFMPIVCCDVQWSKENCILNVDISSMLQQHISSLEKKEILVRNFIWGICPSKFSL